MSSFRGQESAYGNGTAKKRRASGPSPRNHAPGGVPATAYAGVSAAQAQLALNEVARLRASVNALEGQIVGIQAGLKAGRGRGSPYGDAIADEDGMASEAEGRERWEKVWAALPDLYSCEILLEYIFQEVCVVAWLCIHPVLMDCSATSCTRTGTFWTYGLLRYDRDQ